MFAPPEDLTELPTESPSILGRIGQRAVNAPSSIFNDLSKLLFNVGIRDPEQERPSEITTPYEIPEAKTLGEGAVDVGANLAESLPFFLSGEGVGAGVARLAKAGPLLTRMLRVASGFGTQGLTESPGHAATEATLGAGFGAAEAIPGPLKYLTAAGVGLGTMLESKAQGGSDKQAAITGASQGLLPLLTGRFGRSKLPKSIVTEAREAEMVGPRLGYRESIGLRDDQFKLEPESNIQPPPGSLIREPIYSEGEANKIATLQQKPLRQMLRLSSEEELALQRTNGTIEEAGLTRTQPTTEQPFLPLKAPEGSLIRETSVTEEEVSRALAKRKVADGKVIPFETPSKKPANRLLLRSVLSPENTTLAQQAAEKLGLEFKGFWPGTGHIEFKFPEGTDHPASGGNITLSPNATFRDLKNKVVQKTKQFEEGNVKRDKIAADKKVATSQLKEVGPEPGSATQSTSSPETPLPHVEQVQLPQGLQVGNKAVANVEGEAIVGTIQPTVEPGTVRFVQKDGTAHDLPISRIRRIGQTSLESRGPKIENVGGMSEVEAAAAAKTETKMKLPGGGSMKRSNFGESGSISPEALGAMSRYVVAPGLGATIGYAADEQHRPSSAFIGAVAGGLAGHMGGKIFRLLKEGFDKKTAIPKGATSRKSNVLKDLKESLGDDIKDFAKAVTGDEGMARRAASRWGWASEYDKLARWVNKNARIDINITRMRDKAYGITEDLSRAIGDSVKALSRTTGVDTHFPSISNYFEGKISFSTLQAKVPTEVANLAATAVQARTALQNIITESLGEGKLATAINNSVGKYMTTTYKIFHDKKYMPTDEQINTAAKSLEKMFPGETLETRIDHIHEYIHEVKANRGVFSGSFAGAKGETLGTILTRYEGELTPEFKDMLGIYANPLERMGFTAMKLVNGGRSAEFFNEVARGVKENGLKFAYTTGEREATIATLQHSSLYGFDPVVRDAAKAKLEELKSYIPNPSGVSNGRLGGKWMDVKTRDQLANYDSATRMFTTPFLRATAEATNIIKYNKIILSPLQFVRQIIQLPILGAIARTTPVDWARSFKLLQNPIERSRLQRLGILSGDPVGGMLRRDMRAMLDGTLDALLHDKLKDGLHKWEELWRTPDLMIRVSAFTKKEAELLAKGFSKQEAADRAIDFTNRYTMNYGAVPPIIAKGRQLPFVNQYLSWSYETLRITKNLMEDARQGDVYAIGILSTLATTPFIIQSMSESLLSEEDRKVWNQYKNQGPEYSRYNFKFVQERLPNGNFRYIDYTPLVIHDQFMRMTRALMSGDVEGAKSNNPFFGWENTPLLNIAAILTTGRDRFSGNKLTSTVDTANAIWREAAPTLVSTELERIKKALTPNEEGGLGIMNLRTGQTNSITDILQTYATSMRPYTLNPEYLKRQAIADARDQIRSQQLVLRKVMNSNSSAEIKENAKKSFEQARDEILRSFSDRLGIKSEVAPENITQ